MRHDLATFLRDLARGEQFEPAVLSKRARDLLAGKPPPGTPRRKPIPKPPLPGQSREERRRSRNENMAAIRALVMERASGRCEVCSFHPPTEAHHLVSGGARRQSESVETVIATCLQCHKRAHAGDLLTLSLIADWCRRLGYGEASVAVRKRIQKIEEARR